MKTYPLQSLTLAEAQQKQFALVDAISRYFTGQAFLTLGDLGLEPEFNQPQTTHKVEQVLAHFFRAEEAVLVQGAGTGAIRAGLAALLKPGGSLLVHQAPIYPTSKVIIEQMGLKLVIADFNDPGALRQQIAAHPIDAALVQHTRQKPDDSYELAAVIRLLNQHQIPSVVDDNYAVLKVDKIGCEMGAGLSTFSSFKLFGPQGVGVAVGDSKAVQAIRSTLYSGGCQIQGFQALEVLRGLVFAPVMHAVQAQVNQELLVRLNSGELPMVKQALLANAQSKVLLVEFHEPVANQVLQQAEKLGALPYPVGAESKFEIPPLFYRLSGTFREAEPGLQQRMIRINPNRSGAETILRILQQSYSAAKQQAE
ncbi:hypothetical protein Z042_15930 [Chania multitudinisentens RB-25]|uniref:Uncharacterized protein n=1 Tax=Chania multitudinisentens RB-25 TaxID=1441930 RepID=W0LEW8_9GAMM|nr:aminotransferase class V-fold PLP-dependent enzyme [Chania multitudinisentens]AHG20924.1 hypothetical protein Z042_15930 [Chania multitudinisentens RB-25]